MSAAATRVIAKLPDTVAFPALEGPKKSCESPGRREQEVTASGPDDSTEVVVRPLELLELRGMQVGVRAHLGEAEQARAGHGDASLAFDPAFSLCMPMHLAG